MYEIRFRDCNNKEVLDAAIFVFAQSDFRLPASDFITKLDAA
jgi:hypothetical protein